MTTTRTTCPYCGVGCGVLATRHADGSVTVKGDPDHPANFGRLCSKGTALADTLGLEDRLLHPIVDGARATWDAALDRVADAFSEAVRRHGPDSVAFYVSGQLLTEDYYVANKLMKGYIGAANIDSNSRLCMASTVAGQRRAFGSDTVPGNYEDLELADLVVLVGSNLAWCHPVLFQRLLAAREKRDTKIVVIDPRRTATAEAADLHLAIAPDGDVALFAALSSYLRENGMADHPFSQFLTETDRRDDRNTGGAIQKTGLNEVETARFFDLFGKTEKVVTVWSQGVNQSASGTDKVNAIINCHLLTGRIGRPGMGPFSVTGQPNAMGGREVGGLANMLAAHMSLEDPVARERVQRFWGSPTIASQPGLKAVDLFKAVSTHNIKALWIIGTNPVVSMPDADAVASALKTCPFVVVSDVVERTDTTAFGHVLLPAAAWGEKDGTVTNSERRISRQRAFLPAPGVARADWAIIADVARRMGFSGFNFDGPAQIFAEHATLSGFENNGLRDFDISAHATIQTAEYDCLQPFQWPQKAGQPPRETRFFGDGQFFTPDRNARLVAVDLPVKTPQNPALFCINTGRIRDQWHTMTRTGKVPKLMAQFGEPFCDINPQDAETLDISDADLVEITGENSRCIVRARLTERQRRGEVFVPMHWTGQHARTGRVNVVVRAVADPLSGQPALKSGQAWVQRYPAQWYGYAVSSQPFPKHLLETVDYYGVSPTSSGYALEFASTDGPDWESVFRAIPQDDQACAWTDLHMENGGLRLAAFREGVLDFAVFLARKSVEVSRSFIAASLGETFDHATRLSVLAGRAAGAVPDQGNLVCVCRSVGRTPIENLIRSGVRTVDAIGSACSAGTECGSCRSEIRTMINGLYAVPQMEISASQS